MIRESHRVLIALLALTAFVPVARADSVSVSGSCLACLGVISGGDVSAYPMYFSTSSDMSGQPGIAAEFQFDVPWGLSLNAGHFTAASADGDLTISGRITALDVTTTPVFHQPLVYFSTATDSVQWIDPAGQTINIPQTGAMGSGAIGSTGINLQGSFAFGFDLPAAPIPEPGAFALLSVGLFAVLPWLRRRA
jgi:hypothetical protein